MTCKKRGYRDELGAKIALASTRGAGRPSKREECKVYRCPDCRRWHLTSKR